MFIIWHDHYRHSRHSGHDFELLRILPMVANKRKPCQLMFSIINDLFEMGAAHDGAFQGTAFTKPQQDWQPVNDCTSVENICCMKTFLDRGTRVSIRDTFRWIIHLVSVLILNVDLTESITVPKIMIRLFYKRHSYHLHYVFKPQHGATYTV